MTENEKLLKTNLERLRNELNQFIEFFERGYNYDLMIYPLWNAKDILGHITFWHESFARNLYDLGNGIKPNPLKGNLSTVNKLSVETTKTIFIKDLIQRLRDAQRTIEKFIFMKSITFIPYKHGSRAYSREDHLEIVSSHIHRHLNDLIKKYGTAKM
ncbi:hypothetical protein [Arenibacter sp. S6351L]|uniref:hypothetical protein n=1 Tax=Arenibacter sp. S6351L TaxID=2926407 RepID=UPI001FF515DF|nr:hypothetical protein [Arenibacter sp. S6351L]MCK0136109.1 hypothetical protein [Arenibacter sp. S6351L]